MDYGEQSVLEAGESCLGYPGTWITHPGEAIKLETYLNK